MNRITFLKNAGAMLTLSSFSGFKSQPSVAINNMMEGVICNTCGTQFSSKNSQSDVCPICSDDRQYLPEGGQVWTTKEQINANHSVRIHRTRERLYELRITPSFGIGQRAFLLLSNSGNILWDCIPLLDEPTIDFIRTKGRLKAIAFSHPHYYSTMNDWAEEFNCPIYIHEKDEPWVFYKGPHVSFWGGDNKALWDGMKIFNLGGHFPGSSLLHIPSFSPQGTILCGDTLYISRSKRHVAVMHSYPNQIPLPVKEVQRIKERLSVIPFDGMYGAFEFQNLKENVPSIIANSIKRYLPE